MISPSSAIRAPDCSIVRLAAPSGSRAGFVWLRWMKWTFARVPDGGFPLSRRFRLIRSGWESLSAQADRRSQARP